MAPSLASRITHRSSSLSHRISHRRRRTSKTTKTSQTLRSISNPSSLSSREDRSQRLSLAVPGTIRLPVPARTTVTHCTRIFDAQTHGTAAIEDQFGLRRLQSDLSSLIVAVAGTCLSPGLPTASASYGVFFSSSTSSSLNSHGVIPTTSPQTGEYAVLYATMRALEMVHEVLMSSGQELTHVVVKTQSEYLETGMGRYVWKWMGNGWRNAQGRPVVNGRAFRYLNEKVGLLEGKYGVRVSFCRVSRELNGPAEELAKLALL